MWEIDWLKKSFSALLHCSEKKKKKKTKTDGHFREGSLNSNFFIASIKSDYGAIFSFPNKLKLDDSNICTKLLIREQKIIKDALMHTNKFVKNAVNNLDLSSNEDLLFSTTHLSDPVQIAIERYKDHPSIMTVQNNVTIDQSFSFQMASSDTIYVNKSTYSIWKRMARLLEFPPNVKNLPSMNLPLL